MSDPKYNKYEGTVRFDDNNIVDIDLQPDTENIRVLLNGEEVTGGSGLPEVDSSDNGDVLTVVSGEWTNAAPASQLPAVSGSDNGNVLTVVSGAWAKAAPAGGDFLVTFTTDNTGEYPVVTSDKTYAQIAAAVSAGKFIRGIEHIAASEDILPADVYYNFDYLLTAEGGETASFSSYGYSYYTAGDDKTYLKKTCYAVTPYSEDEDVSIDYQYILVTSDPEPAQVNG